MALLAMQVEAALGCLTGLESLSAPQLTLGRVRTDGSAALAALTRLRQLELALGRNDGSGGDGGNDGSGGTEGNGGDGGDLGCLAGMAALERLDLVIGVHDGAGAECLTVLGKLSSLTVLQLTGAMAGGDDWGADVAHAGQLLCCNLDAALQVSQQIWPDVTIPGLIQGPPSGCWRLNSMLPAIGSKPSSVCDICLHDSAFCL